MTPTACCTSPALEAERIVLRRRVLDWRDRWSIDAEVRLSRLCSEQAAEIAPWVASLWAPQLAAARMGVLAYPALPQIAADAGKLAAWLVAKAGDDLQTIIAQHLAIEVQAVDIDASRTFGSGELLAIGRSVVPFAAAGALVATLPALATTTTVAMFGLITTSTVSLPILAAGAAGVGVLGYLGVINTGDLRAGQEGVLIEAIEAMIEARLLAEAGRAEVPSLLAQLQKGLSTHAATVIGSIT